MDGCVARRGTSTPATRPSSVCGVSVSKRPERRRGVRITGDTVNRLGRDLRGFGRASTLAILAAACGGRAEAGSTTPFGPSSTSDGGRDAAAADGANADGPEPCQPLPDGRVLLASGLSLPSFVAAPLATDDPVVVSDFDQARARYRFIDPRTCEVRASWSPGEDRTPIALGGWVAWLEGKDVLLRELISGDGLRVVTLGAPIAIYADAAWFYVISAFVADDWRIATNETLKEAYVQRIPRSDLTRVRNPELVVTLDLSGLRRWNSVGVSGSANQLLLRFAYGQLDVSGPFALLQLRLDTLAQRVLFSNGAGGNAYPVGDEALVQQQNQLLVYSVDLTPRELRNDLDHLTLSGVVPAYAIAPDGWFDRKLLALPLDGGAPRELASDVAGSEGVSTSGDRVYWGTTAGELWMMTP